MPSLFKTDRSESEISRDKSQREVSLDFLILLLKINDIYVFTDLIDRIHIS
jgi:hypothetical protein